jgi:hypothetical protein
MSGAAQGDGIEGALRDLAAGIPGEDASLGDVLAALGPRGHGFAMFLLAAPNLTPGPSLPGFSTIFGVPMLLLALGMVAGLPAPRLPGFLARRRVSRARIARLVGLLAPIASRADRALRPRLPRLPRLAGARRLMGACFVLLALLLVLPFPFVSLAAAGAALLLALGLVAQDGVAVALGLAATAGSVVLYAIFGWLAWAALSAL